jgi:hypothetical protein
MHLAAAQREEITPACDTSRDLLQRRRGSLPATPYNQHLFQQIFRKQISRIGRAIAAEQNESPSRTGQPASICIVSDEASRPTIFRSLVAIEYVHKIQGSS